MIVEIGHYALVLALALAMAQGGHSLRRRAPSRFRADARRKAAAIGQFAFVAIAYAALTYAHVVSDFSLVNVVENSHSLKPLVYKISGVWAITKAPCFGCWCSRSAAP